MNKLPSTQGGAAGSFVRGNEFFKDRPTPYSTTKRGDDTITVTPYGITAKRAPPSQTDDLPIELLTAVRFTPEQVANCAANINPEPAGMAYHLRRLYGMTLSRGETGDELPGTGPQSQLWQYPQGTQQMGRLVSVGDGYFVSVGHAAGLGNVLPDYDDQAPNLNRPRVALMHKSNFSGPYLNTITRQKHIRGGSLRFHKANDGDRGLPDAPGDRLSDAFGANYYLQECEDLWQCTANAAGDFAYVGAKVSVVPLGWMDSAHRYAFAVFGLSLRHMGNSSLSCYVYCTGTRAVIHAWPDLPRHPGNDNRPWVGLAECDVSAPGMFSLGRGMLAALLIPHTEHALTAGGATIGAHCVAAGFDPCMLISRDFGATWQITPQPLLRELAHARADGSHTYPPLRVQMLALDEQGGFVLSVAAMNQRLSGDVPSAAFDETAGFALDQLTSMNNGTGLNSRWISAGHAQRMSFMTLFKGDATGGLTRLTTLDAYQLRFGDWPATFAGSDTSNCPPGIYRYNVLLNADVGAHTARLACLGEGSLALLARTIEVTFPEWSLGGDYPPELLVFKELETFALQSDDGGATWAKHVLPAQALPFADAMAYAERCASTASDPQAMRLHYRNWAPVLPGRAYLGWCLTQSRGKEVGGRLAQLAMVVPQLDGVTLQVTKTIKSQLQSNGQWSTAWTLRRHSSLPAEAFVPVVFDPYAWEFGGFRPAPALIYLGDAQSEDYRAWIWPALPGALEKNQ